MKTFTFVVASLLASLPFDAPARAGGLIQKLPKDGAWAKYSLEIKGESSGAARESSGVVTIRSVGSTTFKREKCRWIEVKSVSNAGKKTASVIIKVLFREKDLKPGNKSAPRIIRGWQLHPSSKFPTKVTNDAMVGESGLWMLFGAKRIKERPVKKQTTVEFQKGKLSIDTAKTSELDIPFVKDPPKDLKVTGRQTVWKHKSIPFGTAALQLGWSARHKGRSGKLSFTYTLQDYGTGAKSDLPDKK